uniref:AAA domain-containing protein n=1 Tax=viral metagenome TaxID=1070528 RepID=A0A6C0B5E2_9ZZZZ
MLVIPSNLDDFIYNKNIANRLKIYNINYLENLIFYGQNNAGKRTLISGLLNHLSGNNIKRNMRTQKLKVNNTKVEINFVESNYHFEINLYEYGHYDKHIICEFVKFILTYKNINKLKFKIVVLHYFDKVSKIAQLALRRIIEKSSDTGRFILCCENINRIDKALLSRFIYIRVPKPKISDMENYITLTLRKYNKTYGPELIKTIIDYSGQCIYKINLIIQHYIDNGQINKNIINETDIIMPIIKEINKPTINSMLNIRKIIYKYLLLNFTPKKLFYAIIKYYNSDEILSIENISKLNFIAAKIDSMANVIKYDIIVLETLILNIKLLMV